MGNNTTFHYDALNDFGTLDAPGDFPNILNLVKASADRMTVDLKLPAGNIESQAGVTLQLKGSDTEGGTYEKIIESGVLTEEIIGEGYGLPIPKTKYKFLKVAISGIFTGRVQAIINSHLGI